MKSHIPKTFEAIFRQAEKSEEYWQEKAVLAFARMVNKKLTLLHLKQADLAERLEVAPAYISKLLRGSTNCTLRTMVKTAFAMHCEIDISMKPMSQGYKRERPLGEGGKFSMAGWSHRLADQPEKDFSIEYKGRQVQVVYNKVDDSGTRSSTSILTHENCATTA